MSFIDDDFDVFDDVVEKAGILGFLFDEDDDKDDDYDYDYDDYDDDEF